MQLTSKQLLLVSTVETLLSIKLNASFCKRNTVSIELEDGRSCSESTLYNAIDSLCAKYGLGRVEPNGRNHLAIIMQ